MRHANFLDYRRSFYLKFALVLSLVAIIAYIWHRPVTGSYGGSWLGYTLGTIGALLIFMLLWFGVRKRQYSTSADNLLGWLSAHVYLGSTLIVIATLHTGFEVGWNVHTLAYGLMLAVIVSGFYGVYAYLRYPSQLTRNMGEDSLDSLLLKIAAQDREARNLALQLPDEINRAVLAAAQETRIGGNSYAQLIGRVRDCPTTAAVRIIQQAGRSLKGDAAKRNHKLYAILLQKQSMVERARTDISYRARMTIWLYLHVPLAVGLLAALIAHVVSVFFYW